VRFEPKIKGMTNWPFHSNCVRLAAQLE